MHCTKMNIDIAVNITSFQLVSAQCIGLAVMVDSLPVIYSARCYLKMQRVLFQRASLLMGSSVSAQVTLGKR